MTFNKVFATLLVAAVTITTPLVHASNEPQNDDLILIDLSESNVNAEEVILEEHIEGEIISFGEYVVFLPEASFDGELQILSDEGCEESICEMSLEIMVNTGPVQAMNDMFVLSSFDPADIDVLANDLSLLTGESLFVSGFLMEPDHGTGLITDGSILFQPEENYTGVTTMHYEACNSLGDCDSAYAYVTVDTSPDEVSEEEDNLGVCGDGIYSPESGEQCDDGNTNNNDLCSNSCHLQKAKRTVNGKKTSVINICGNKKVEKAEQCDDGNTKSGDGCSSSCALEETTITVVNKKIKQTITTVIPDTTQVTTQNVDTTYIFTLLMPHLKKNDIYFTALIEEYLEDRSILKQRSMYKKVLDKFPEWAYKKFNLNQSIIEIWLKVKIHALS